MVYNSVESEIHFLLECPFYDNIHTSLLNGTNICLNDNPNDEIINILMNNHQRTTLNHIFDMWLKEEIVFCINLSLV